MHRTISIAVTVKTPKNMTVEEIIEAINDVLVGGQHPKSLDDQDIDVQEVSSPM